MKKIIALFVIMLAFGVNANAQQTKAKAAPAPAKAAPATAKQQSYDVEAVRKAASRDLELMSSSLDLTEDQKKDYKGLFETKHRTLITNPNLSNERKAVIAQNMETKIKSLLDSDQLAKLDSNPELLKALIN
ncbi:hypothetical protein OGH69_00175 [Flavobacterium sp. MFBS3-15]|uniref:hypothetical protein n=1 Tax=Flavobacterium sp. MFBS3-15 TaxID=2989816 RepID=UPI002236887D|nr:hypothetical protein [Flavobacterium sp. MFBS3-15]MCW4467372.1 hypothetical protein [Flavobacterium sp. MFBS3-15]